MRNSEYVKTNLTPAEMADLYTPTRKIEFPILNTIYELQQSSIGRSLGVNKVSIYKELLKQGVLNPSWSKYQIITRIGDYLDSLNDRGDVYISYVNSFVEFFDELVDYVVYEDITKFIANQVEKYIERFGPGAAKLLNTSMYTLRRVKANHPDLKRKSYEKMAIQLGYETVTELKQAMYRR